MRTVTQVLNSESTGLASLWRQKLFAGKYKQCSLRVRK